MCLKLEVSHTSQDCIPASWSNLPSPLLTLHHLFISHFEILAFGLSGIIFVKCRWKKVFNVFSFKKEKQNFTVTACWQIYRKSLSLVSLFKSNIALCGCRTFPPPPFFFFDLFHFFSYLCSITLSLWWAVLLSGNMFFLTSFFQSQTWSLMLLMLVSPYSIGGCCHCKMWPQTSLGWHE